MDPTAPRISSARSALPPCPFSKLYPSELNQDDRYFMAQAYNESIRAWEADEVPVGAVITYAGKVIARSYNQVNRLKDPTAHAEVLALTQASQAIGDWRLNQATLYVTKEPCPMCAGASIMARLQRVVFAIHDPKMGCLGGATALHGLPQLNHHLTAEGGLMEAECLDLFQAYFQLKRLKTEATSTDS